MKHDNANGDEGYWVGFGVPHVEGNVYYTGWGSVPESLDKTSSHDNTMEQNGKTYDTFYWGSNFDNFAKGGYLVVKNGDKMTTYNITFDVTKYQADVSVLTDIPSAILTNPDKDSNKTAAALGLTAATNGATVTLSGETTTCKLDATDETTQNGYLLYGFNVGSKLITQLVDTDASNPTSLVDFSKGGTVAGADSMKNAALLNIQIWDNVKSSFIKKTISMELKDAADRVQDTVELTVDATGCKIEGLHSVTFKDAVDGKAIQSISVANNGKVTQLPSDPSKKGFKFLGWYYSSAETESEFTAETQVADDMTVYAKWEDLKLQSVATDFGDKVSATVGEDGMSVVLSGTVPVDKLTYSAKTFTSKAITLTVNGVEGKKAAVPLTYDAKTGKFSTTSGTFEVDGTNYNVSVNNLFIAKTDVTPEARENGPAEPIKNNDYNYKAAYEKAGVTFSPKGTNAISYTVDAAKLTGFCVSGNKDDIQALTHQIGGTNYLYVGIQFNAPAEIKEKATKAMRYINDAEEAFDLSADGENAYKKNPMAYIAFGSYTVSEGESTTYVPVASDAKPYEVVTYWMGSDDTVLAVNFSTVTRNAPTNK